MSRPFGTLSIRPSRGLPQRSLEADGRLAGIPLMASP